MSSAYNRILTYKVLEPDAWHEQSGQRLNHHLGANHSLELRRGKDAAKHHHAMQHPKPFGCRGMRRTWWNCPSSVEFPSRSTLASRIPTEILLGTHQEKDQSRDEFDSTVVFQGFLQSNKSRLWGDIHHAYCYLCILQGGLRFHVSTRMGRKKTLGRVPGIVNSHPSTTEDRHRKPHMECCRHQVLCRGTGG